MAGIHEIVQNLDKRVGALESEGIEDSATLTQIKKLYAGIEFEIAFTYWLHEYRRCGDTNPLFGATCGTDVYI